MDFHGRGRPEEQVNVTSENRNMDAPGVGRASGVPGGSVSCACLVIVLGTPSPGSVAVEMRVGHMLELR
jgi:hypothetical protein